MSFCCLFFILLLVLIGFLLPYMILCLLFALVFCGGCLLLNAIVFACFVAYFGYAILFVYLVALYLRVLNCLLLYFV